MPSTNSQKTPSTAIIAYVPALHAGYKRLFDKHPDAVIYVYGKELIQRFDHLRKDLRALKPEEAVQAIEGWGRHAEVADVATLRELAASGKTIIMPNEDVAHELAKAELSSADIEFATTFLRWDRRKMEAEKDVLHPDREVSESALDQELLSKAVEEGRKSTNFWRRVGGLIVKNGKIILQAHNNYEPTPSSNWMDGDPRNNANRGVSVDITTDIHAEVDMIGAAARQGVSLEGASLYITTLPCPVCAKVIARSGIKKVYYATGYAVLDGEEVLKNNGVELIHVTGVNTDDPDPEVWEPYPEKRK